MAALVSVVMPCFNGAPMLEAALRSVIGQTYSDIEIVFVDNNSTDGSVEVAKAMARQSPRPIRIAHCADQGCNYARNLGYSMATGQYIQWLDADDALVPEKIARQVAALEHDRGASIAYCDWMSVHHSIDGRRRDRRMPLTQVDDQLFRAIAGEWYPPHVYLLRRDAADLLQAERAWLPERKICTDIEYSAIAALLGLRFVHVAGAEAQYNKWSNAQLSAAGKPYDMFIAAYREIYARLRQIAERPEVAPRVTPRHRVLLDQTWDIWQMPRGSVEITEISSRLHELRHVATGHAIEVGPRESMIARTMMEIGAVKAMAHHTLLIAHAEPSLENDYPFIMTTLDEFRQQGLLTPASGAAVQGLDDVREGAAADGAPSPARRRRQMPTAIPKSSIEYLAWPAVVTGSAAVLLAQQQQLADTQWWPAADLEQAQFQALRRLMTHVHATLPFYAAPLKDAGYRPGQEITWEFWRRLPILSRQDVAAAGDAMISTAVPEQHGKLHQGPLASAPRTTSLRWVSTDMANLMWQSFALREELWHGRDFSLPLGLIRPGLEATAPYPQGYRRGDWGPPVATVYPSGSVVLLDVKTATAQQAEWLGRTKPAYLLTPPSNLHALARFFEANKLTLPELRGLRTEGEVVDDDLRRLCRAVWGVGIADLYAVREAGHIAFQCPEQETYHVQSESALVEVLNERGEPCGPGEPGQVVVTPLHNYAMPLIRYALGDTAEIGPPCPCGRGLPVLTRLLTRQSPSALTG